MRCVIFATPSLDHRVCLEFMRSTLETEWLLAEKQIPHGYLVRGGDCFVAKVRNKLAWEFLTKYPMGSHLFFLDDDIGWSAHKVVEFIERDLPIVAGVYPKKSDEPDWPVEIAADPETGVLIEKDGLVRAHGIPGGFLCIRRDVLEALAVSAPRFKDLELDGSIVEYPAIFNTGIGPDGWFWGEDYVFAKNAAAAGYEIWVDPNIAFTHRGNKKWTGTLSDSLNRFRERGAEAIAARTQDAGTGISSLPSDHDAPDGAGGADGKRSKRDDH